MNEIKTYYVIPITEFYNHKVSNLRKFMEIFEDYKIKDATEKNITDVINTYNFEEEKKYFQRLKSNDFYFCRITEIEIGKYKTGKVEVLDMWKK